MKHIFVGTFRLGPENVDLYLRDDMGGDLYFQYLDGLPRMVIGGGYDKWHHVVEVLLHEAMELVMARIGCRFEPAPDYARDHGAYLFVMRHDQFSEVSARVAGFMSHAMPELARVWKKNKKKLM